MSADALLIQGFSKRFCDHNWLLSVYIFNVCCNIFNGEEIRLLNIGNGHGGFISGLYYCKLHKLKTSYLKFLDCVNDINSNKSENLKDSNEIGIEESCCMNLFATNNVSKVKNTINRTKSNLVYGINKNTSTIDYENQIPESEKKITANAVNIKWIGVDINNNDNNPYYTELTDMLYITINPESYKFFHNKSRQTDILNYNTIIKLSQYVEQVYNDTNFIFNNVAHHKDKPKILLSMAVFSLYNLNSTGILVTRIAYPEIWAGNYLDYLLILALLFYKIKIFRFPVCKNKKLYFRYYMLCINPKQVYYNNIIGKRLLQVLNNKSIINPVLIDNFIDKRIMDDFTLKIKNLQSIFITKKAYPHSKLIKYITESFL